MQQSTLANKMKNCFLLVLCLFFPLIGFSQFVITNNASAVSLAHAFVGSGINVSNATLDCGGNSTATFTYSGTNLGLPNGVVLTSGHASDVANTGTYFCNVQNGNNLNDPDVIAISSQARYDDCLLEFDFIPVCDTLHITYVFGSEEYPEYVCSQFNDAFAFFITGPGIPGGTMNMAKLPTGAPCAQRAILGARLLRGLAAFAGERAVDDALVARDPTREADIALADGARVEGRGESARGCGVLREHHHPRRLGIEAVD